MTKLYLSELPYVLSSGTLPSLPQTGTIAGLGGGVNWRGSSVLRTLSFTIGVGQISVGDSITSLAQGVTRRDFVRAFATAPLRGGIYNPIRPWKLVAAIGITDSSLVGTPGFQWGCAVSTPPTGGCYIWRPSTGAIVYTFATPLAQNAFFLAWTTPDNQEIAYSVTVNQAGNATLQPINILDGDILIFETFALWTNGGGSAQSFGGRVWYDGTQETSSGNATNQAAFLETPWDLKLLTPASQVASTFKVQFEVT